MNQPEFVVRRLNVFANSEDRQRDVGSDSQSAGASLRIPMDSLDVHARDNEFIRLKLQMLCVPNTFDNHIAFDQQAYLYLGQNVVPKAADADLPSSSLRHAYLTLPSYQDYTSLMLDATQMVASLFQTVYQPSAWTLAYTELRGFGLAIPSDSAGSVPGVAGNPPLGYSNIGEFRQNGTRALVGEFTLTQTAPQFYGDALSGITAPQFDNSSMDTSFVLTSAQSSDIYLLLGGRKSSLTSSNLASTAAYEAGPILGNSTTDVSQQLLNLSVSVSSIGGGLYQLTVRVLTVLRMQLRVNHQIYLRTNMVTTSYSTDNMNQREGVESSAEVSSSGIWACVPIQSPVCYYQNNGGDQWVLDLSQRSITELNLYITNKDNLVPSIDNPTPQPDFNLHFEIAFTIEILQRAKVVNSIPLRDREGEVPARFSNVWKAQDNGAPPRSLTFFNQVARMRGQE